MRDTRIHETAVVDPGARIGAGTAIWHFCHVMSGARIGQACVLGQNCFVADGARTGDRCKLQNNVSLFAGVWLADDVFCGPSVVFTNVLNPRAFIERKSEFRPTHVGRGATLGANATIVCGVTIGDYALIGAGSVVTRDVPAHALVTGVPGRVTGWVSRAGHRLDFSGGEVTTCPETHEAYRQTDSGHLELLADARGRTKVACPVE